MAIRVGILSMQRIKNYGSFLQAYGLKHIMEDMGCEVQFVDYHPGETIIPADGGKGVFRLLSKVKDVLTQRGPLKEKIRFIKYKKNFATNYYPYLGITETYNYTPDIDLLIIGSDEVFNCVQNNTNVGFTSELFGQGNNANRLISYAASFGNTTLELLNKYDISGKIASWLKEFDSISVRDKNSGEIINKLIGIEPEYNLDPVIIYDYIGECREIPNSIPDNGYIILYGYSGRFTSEECKYIKSFAKTKGLKVFCIGGVQECCDKFIDENPFVVISYFQHAEYVITDTFHGTILSIITHRQFISVVRDSLYGNNYKMNDLLERFGLINRRLENLKDINDVMLELIDYCSVDEIINIQREKSKNYLKKEIMNNMI